jgi:predicted secreted protein
MATAAYNFKVLTGTGGGAGTPSATLAGVNDASITVGGTLIDVSAMDGTSDFVKRIRGLKDFPMTISGFFNPADAAYTHIKANFVSGTTLGIKFDYSGGASFQCVDMMVESIEVSASVDGAQEVSISLQSNATLSFAP